jgi:hypothetical protein
MVLNDTDAYNLSCRIQRYANKYPGSFSDDELLVTIQATNGVRIEDKNAEDNLDWLKQPARKREIKKLREWLSAQKTSQNTQSPQAGPGGKATSPQHTQGKAGPQHHTQGKPAQAYPSPSPSPQRTQAGLPHAQGRQQTQSP